MFKWLKKKVMPPQLSELGAEIMEAMQNPGEWEANEHVLHHRSGLDLWVANRDSGATFFSIYRLPGVVTHSFPEAARAGEKRLEEMLSKHDKRALAPVAYALHGTLCGTLESATLNALRLARQTEPIDQ